MRPKRKNRSNFPGGFGRNSVVQLMKDIIIRQATINDYDSLLQFEQGVISAERPFDPTLKQDPVRYYDIGQMIAAEDVHLLVAVHEGQLIGCGYARLEVSKGYLRHARHAYLGFMYTHPEYRGRGVNQSIIDALKAWSTSKGVFEMRLDVYEGNTSARRAYEKAGFSGHMLQMRMGVTGH
jgi:GNAT superfamily N-acetyltransferase